MPGKAKPKTREREQIEERYRWRREDIFDDWDAWQQSYQSLEQLIGRYAALKGTLATGPQALLTALKLADELGQLAYRVWYFAGLAHDENQRDNEVDAKRQMVQILFAKQAEASSWFEPELLEIPLDQLRRWLAESAELAVYRFALEEVYRQQEHVLDRQGERLLSLLARARRTPQEAYAALSTADMRWPELELSDGDVVTLSYGEYQAILATRRAAEDRAAAWKALYGCFEANINTYAALYNGICQRDWFFAQARGYPSTLHAALHPNNVPPKVVENLIAATRAGVAPLRRYHQLRKRVLGLERYHLYDGQIPLLELERQYCFDDVAQWIVDSVAPLGEAYQQEMRAAFEGRWIDVYENDGKRAGAYSAPVYGVHPYVLLNYNDTLNDVFTLAHELGHSLHTVLSHQNQPFVYAGYTIFVAEVASTLNEALLLELLLERSDDPAERALLLQHAIDAICGTFYTQVLFADWELAAHRLVEQGQPLTAESLGQLYLSAMEDYFGDAVALPSRYGITWARIPHFFATPYYVYQYATCFASSAALLRRLRSPDHDPQQVIEGYLGLLRAGGSDHPMELLRRAGVDLEQPETVGAVSQQLDDLVDRLEQELAAVG